MVYYFDLLKALDAQKKTGKTLWYDANRKAYYLI